MNFPIFNTLCFFSIDGFARYWLDLNHLNGGVLNVCVRLEVCWRLQIFSHY